MNRMDARRDDASPRPWRLAKDGIGVFDANGEPVKWTLANMALAVRAVNLMEAL